MNNKKRKILVTMLCMVMCTTFFTVSEIANASDGNILFSDDFEDGNADGWTIAIPPGTAFPWTINWEVLQDNDNYVYSGEGGYTGGGGNSIAFAGDFLWIDYTVKADVKIAEVRNPGSHHGIVGRYQDEGHYYEFAFWGPGGAFLERLDGQLPGNIITYLSKNELEELGIEITQNNWYELKMEFQGESIKCYINDTLIFDVNDPIYANGAIGLYNAGAETYFDNVSVWVDVTPASIDLKPNTLNLKSKGKWMTGYIELSDEYDLYDIDISTVKISQIGDMNVEIFASSKPTNVGDYDDDGVADLMVKFNRQNVIDALDGTTGDIEFTVVGEVNETLFEGKDTVKVINGGLKKEALGEDIESTIPAQFALFQNYPNPANPETSIKFSIKYACHIRLTIYNTLGQAIRTLVNDVRSLGNYTVRWDGKDKNGNAVSSGIYFYRLQAGTFSQVKKMSLIR